MKSLFVLTCAAAAVSAQRPAPVPPSTGAIVSGKWRNMLVEAGYAQADIDAKIAAAYQMLYHGSETQRIYWEVADGTSYVSDVKNRDVRTEGVGPSAGDCGPTQPVYQPAAARCCSIENWHCRLLYTNVGAPYLARGTLLVVPLCAHPRVERAP